MCFFHRIDTARGAISKNTYEIPKALARFNVGHTLRKLPVKTRQPPASSHIKLFYFTLYLVFLQYFFEKSPKKCAKKIREILSVFLCKLYK